MKRIKSVLIILLVLLSAGSIFAQSKLAEHIATIPFIEGLGVFSTVSAITNSDNTLTRTAAITGLSVLSTQVVLGIINGINYGKPQNKVRLIHRITGYTNIAVALFFNIVTSLDEQLDNKAPRYTGYAYTLFSTIPIFTWRF